MRAPTRLQLAGLRTAMAAALASPAGGDFTQEDLRHISYAQAWLEREIYRGEMLRIRRAKDKAVREAAE